jgi:hypothetical protein
MTLAGERLRAGAWTALKRLGLVSLVFRAHGAVVSAINPEFRRLTRLQRERFRAFERDHAGVIGAPVKTRGAGRRVLVFNLGTPGIEFELGLIKALEAAGCRADVLIVDTRIERLLQDYCRLNPAVGTYLHRDFVESIDVRTAASMLNRCRSLSDVLALEHAGVRVGKYAVSTAMRRHYLGTVDLDEPAVRRLLLRALVASMSFAEAAHRILDRLRPDCALFHDCAYAPEGELFDACLRRGVDAISWFEAHKPNGLLLKRYTWESRGQHPWSLSPESWASLQRIPWTAAHRAQVDREIHGSYARGDWQHHCGAQVGKRMVEVEELRSWLGLHPGKKTACIFPHILWDAPFAWGENLFDSYETWLIETVRAACANPEVNWVIKIHPANVWRGVIEGRSTDPTEVAALRRQIGDLPPHISFIPADHPVSTYSLFELMDYCVTVRGTVGLEASRLGIPVLTAGTGRYDRKGFTVDSDSKDEYLDRLARIQHLPRLTPKQQELADRFAFGSFVQRVLPLSTLTFERDRRSLTYGLELGPMQIQVRNADGWRTAADLQAFARWVTASSVTDFLVPPSTGARQPGQHEQGEILLGQGR